MGPPTSSFGVCWWVPHTFIPVLMCAKLVDLLLELCRGSRIICVGIITCICMVVIMRCVRSTDLHLLHLICLWCVRGLPICSWAVLVDLSRIISLLYGIWCAVCEVYRRASVFTSVGLDTSHASSYLLWGVRSPPTCSWSVSVGLSRIISFCCGVCEVYRFARGLCRWISQASSNSLYLMWCVWGVPTCSWFTSVGLSCIFLIIVMCVRSTDMLLGCVGGSFISHILLFSYFCFVVIWLL